MKIEKLSSNKFRLTFTGDDLKEFDVDFENLKYNSEDAKDVLWQLIEHADIDENFFDGNAQIVVEAVATKNDGLSMTVTRVADISRGTPKIRRKNAEHKRMRDNSPLIYSFDSFEKLTAACKHLENIFVGASKLYKLDGEYYLEAEAINCEIAISADLMLCEYGEKIRQSDIFCGKLAEYGDLLIKDTAIANISMNF